MYVNNEVGAVQPVDEIARIVKEHNPNTIFPCGCDSGLWKIPDLSEERGYRSSVGQRTQDSRAERNRIFICQ